jgi:YVTN family beta-propeller protein
MPYGIAIGGNHIWVTNDNSNSVTELDTTGNVLRTIGVGTTPTGIAFDGTHFWVANNGSNTVQRL